MRESVEVRLSSQQKLFLREMARQAGGRDGMSGVVRNLVEEAMRGEKPSGERAAYRILTSQWELYQQSVLRMEETMMAPSCPLGRIEPWVSPNP